MPNGHHQPPRSGNAGPVEKQAGFLEEAVSMPQDARNEPRGPNAYGRNPCSLATRFGDRVRALVVILFWLVTGILALSAAGAAIAAVVLGLRIVLRALGV